MSTTHVAKVRCKACQEIIVSEGGGIFRYCKCGKSFIDQERVSAMWVRLGGEAEFISQACPPSCKQKDHKGNEVLD